LNPSRKIIEEREDAMPISKDLFISFKIIYFPTLLNTKSELQISQKEIISRDCHMWFHIVTLMEKDLCHEDDLTSERRGRADAP
jgi:hypothetical protein